MPGKSVARAGRDNGKGCLLLLTGALFAGCRPCRYLFSCSGHDTSCHFVYRTIPAYGCHDIKPKVSRRQRKTPRVILAFGMSKFTMEKGAVEIAPDVTLEGTFVATTGNRSEEHTSELQSLMRSSYAVFCLKKKKKKKMS